MSAALLIVLLLAPQAAGWRAAGRAFGEEAQAEVRGLAREEAETALRAAIAELTTAEGEVASLSATLNANAGVSPVAVDAGALSLLQRSLDFCRWSDGAHGPLGGALHELWQGSLPAAADVRAALASAGCDRLRLDREAGIAELAAGSRVDLRGFAPGWAVDRAVELLRGHGAASARVRLGGVRRGFGPGPSGDGWAIDLGLPSDWIEPLPPVRLRDRAVAVASREPALVIGGDSYARHLNLRAGRPGEGAAATIAVSELAIDAQALAIAMFVLGQREGMMRLGALRPEPSVAWLLGSGDGLPLLTTHRWATVD